MCSKFVGGTRFSDADLQVARDMSTVDVISSRMGFTFHRVGYEYKCKEHDSLVVFSDGKGWCWYSKNDCKGNNAISFLMKVEKLNFQEAVVELINPSGYKFNYAEESKIEKPKVLILPEKSKSNYHVEKYLQNQRGIAPSIVSDCIKKGYLYQDKYKNCVFVGYDENGVAKYASKRGTYTHQGSQPYKRDCTGSNKIYGFLMDGNCQTHVFVFEAPIDVLSHATLNMEKAKGLGRSDYQTSWQNHTRLALGGVSDKALARYLIVNPNITTISFCLDNDETGRSHAEAYKEKYEKEGYKVNVYNVPTGKGSDYNEYLQNFLVEKNSKQKQMFAQKSYSNSNRK